MKRRNKLVASFLAVVMMLSMVPAAAFAEGGHTHTDDCYTVYKEPQCNLEHEHNEDCYRVKTCAIEVGEADDSSNAESLTSLNDPADDGKGDNPAAAFAEGGHTHTDDCYNVYEEPQCNLEHEEHNDDCFRVKTCTIEVGEADDSSNAVSLTSLNDPADDGKKDDDKKDDDKSPYLGWTAQQLFEEYKRLLAIGDAKQKAALDAGEEFDENDHYHQELNDYILAVDDLVDEGLIDDDVFIEFMELVQADANLTGEGINFIPVDAWNEYDVQINGEGDIITIYCLQQKYRWPEGFDNAEYFDQEDVQESEFEYRSLLNENEIAILKKLVFAGYPSDSQGFFRDNWLDDPEYAGSITQGAIWSLMGHWQKPGYKPDQKDLVLERPDEDDIGEVIMWQLIQFALDDNRQIVYPETDDILIEGSTTFNELPTGQYATDFIQITRPVGLKLLFSLGLPEGVYAEDESGWEVTEISENTPFRLIADSREKAENIQLKIDASLKYPGDVTFYVTNSPSPAKFPDGSVKPFQTMLSVPTYTQYFSKTVDLTRGDENKVSVAGHKTWNDANDKAGKRPESILIRLHADGVLMADKFQTVTADNNWEYEFSDLPKYANGHEVVYTITEDEVPDYTTVYHGNNVTNTYNPGMTTVTVEKSWIDDNNRDGLRPTSIVVKLFANGEDTGKTLTITEEGNWQGTFDNLPATTNGQTINYTVKEVPVRGYTLKPDIGIGSLGMTDGYVLVNVHEVEKTSVSGSKTWNDNNNQDGKRPEQITVRLHADGKEVDSKVVTADDNWSWSFTNLNKYENGHEIKYSVTEDEVLDYTTTYDDDSYNITNSYTPGKTSVSVKKVWADNDNQDGIRPANVTITLYADGKITDKTLVLEAANNWRGTFTDLDEYKDGKLIHYTVAEPDVPTGYGRNISGSAIHGFTVTNTHIPETVNVRGSKTWDMSAAADGETHPDSVTVHLLANGVVKHTLTVGQGDGWTWKFDKLPKYDKGEEITYTVSEEHMTNYTTTYDNYDITNKYTPNYTSVTVEKVWHDDNDRDGLRPDGILVRLYKNGEATNNIIELNHANNWMGTFENLLEKDDNGTINYYTVKEEGTIAGYTSAVTGDSDTSYIISNTHVIETVDISGSKTWNDKDDQDGKRPASITVRLRANGHEIANKVVTAEDNWSWTWEKMPKFEGGQLIKYTITEDTVHEYDSTYRDYDVINSYTPNEISLSVSKSWEDNNNQDGKRPDKVTVILYADGVATDKSLDLSEANNWEGIFHKLPENKDGKKIVYTIKENAVDDYKAVITGSADKGFTVTNSHTPETVNVTGEKTWDMNGHDSETLPESITIRLHANGKELQHVTVKNPGEDNAWTWSFTGLPKYHNGNLIDYTITEDHVPGYVTAYDDYNVTNTYDPDHTTVTVEKIWHDNENQDGKRPTSITVKLMQVKGETTEPVKDASGNEIKLELSAGNKWQGTFTNLDIHDTESNVIVYTVQEELTDKMIADGYVATVSGSMDKGYEITNTYTTKTIKVEGSKTWNDAENQDGKRPETITIRLLADNVELEHKKVSAADDWKWSFTNLPKYSKGKEIKYTITEDSVPEYESTVNGFNVTNTYTPGKVEVNVGKVWVDDSNRDGIRPTSVTIKLFADGTDTNKTLTLNQSNNWRGKFENLDEYKDGTKIVYTVTENAVTGYTTETRSNSDYDFVVTNTHTSETVTISGTKVWEDGNNLDGSRPRSITVNLFANGVKVDSKSVTAANNWAWSFDNMPKKSSGAVITYTVNEDSVTGYTASISGNQTDGFKITNMHTPQVFGNLTVSKKVAGNGASTERYFHFTVTLSDKTVSGTYGGMTFIKGVAEFDLRHNQSVTATGLPAGVTYVVSENNYRLYGYSVSSIGATGTILKNQTASAAFTNTRVPYFGAPRTGDTANMALWISLLAVSVIGIGAAVFFVKKKKK